MPRLAQIEQALIAADAAGNVKDATALAQAYAAERGRSSFANVSGGSDTAANDPAPNPAEGMGVGERLMVGMGRGASGVYEGIKQGGLQAGEAVGLVEPGTADEYTQRIEGEHNFYAKYADRLGNAGKVGEFIGSAAAVPIPGVGAGAPLAARLGGAAAMGAAQGDMEFVPEGGSRGANALLGAGTGLAFQGVVGEPLRAGAKRIAALAAGGKQNLTDKAANALAYAKTNNLPIYYDDVAGSPAARTLGTFTDDLPLLGTGNTRKRQAEAAGQAANNLVQRFDTPNTANVADTLADSAANQLARAKGIKTTLYQDAFAKLNAAGDVDLPGTRALAKQMIAHNLKKGTLADPVLMRELERYADAPNFNFEGWHGVRADLGSTIRKRMIGENAVLSDGSAAQLMTLKRQMDADMGKVAAGVGGDAASAWKRADGFYKDVIPKYKRGVVADLLKSKNPDAIADRILNGKDSENIARQVYQALDRDGRAEVRGTLLQRALEKANVVTPEGGEVFSPGTFSRELSKMEGRTAAFFKKDDQAEIEGLKNYMQFVKASGTYALNPATGRRMLPHIGLLVGSGVLGPKAVGAYAGTTLASRLLLRTQIGRDLMIRMGKVSPTSKAAEQTMQQVNAYLQRGLASEGADLMNPSPTPGVDVVGGRSVPAAEAAQMYSPENMNALRNLRGQ